MAFSFLNNFIGLFERFPGVGPKTAERYAFYLLKRPRAEIENFIYALEQIKENIKLCRLCQNFSMADPCEICSDRRRNHALICVVEEAADMLALEKTGEYKGVYHLLGGLISPADGITPEKLKIKELLWRIKEYKKRRSGAVEIIFGLNATIEGEGTSLYLARVLRPLRVKITRLARGLPQGSDLQYADEITLLNALRGRRGF